MPHTVYDCKLGVDGSNDPRYLRQVTNTNFNENITVLDGRASGSQYLSDQFVQSSKPMADITTVDIGGFMTIFGTEGDRIGPPSATQPDAGTNVIVPWRTRSSGGSHLSGSNHSAIQSASDASRVQLVPQSISCPRNGAVTAQGQIHFLSEDGADKPHLVFFDDRDLAAQTFQAMYGLGPIQINGRRVPYQVGYNLNFGVGVSEMQDYEGAAYPVDCFLETFAASVDMTVEDFGELYEWTGGANITSAFFYVRRRTTGGTYYPNGDSEHVCFGFPKGFAAPQQIAAADTKHGQTMIRLTCQGELELFNPTTIDV